MTWIGSGGWSRLWEVSWWSVAWRPVWDFSSSSTTRRFLRLTAMVLSKAPYNRVEWPSLIWQCLFAPSFVRSYLQEWFQNWLHWFFLPKTTLNQAQTQWEVNNHCISFYRKSKHSYSSWGHWQTHESYVWLKVIWALCCTFLRFILSD